uniref:Uncharacterized protein n=1 Tax=Arundo donax TaxID=35708 RepID=A0A0A8YGR2_ARUDO
MNKLRAIVSCVIDYHLSRSLTIL